MAHGVLEQEPEVEAALIALDNRTGRILAMVGGYSFDRSKFNRATQAKRQPGSTFKLFVYLTALNQGWSPEDRINNSQITQGGYRPQNAAGRYSDTIALQDAFAHSSNVAAVRLFEEVGSKAVIATARDLGVTSPLAKGDPSLALGTSTMTLLELTPTPEMRDTEPVAVTVDTFIEMENTALEINELIVDSLLTNGDHLRNILLYQQVSQIIDFPSAISFSCLF